MCGAPVQIYKGLAKQGAGKVDPFLIGLIKKLSKAVNNYGITPENYQLLTRAYGRWAAPEQIKTSVNAFESMTNAFKALAYPNWLPSHDRNAGRAAVNNARHGVGWQDYAARLQAMTGLGTRDLSAIHPSLAGLAPAEQAAQPWRMQYARATSSAATA